MSSSYRGFANEDDYYDAKCDAENEVFEEWCRENDIDPQDDDAHNMYKEAEYEQKHPYASRGLSEKDFI
jgi:hypothetical protein